MGAVPFAVCARSSSPSIQTDPVVRWLGRMRDSSCLHSLFKQVYMQRGCKLDATSEPSIHFTVGRP